MNEIENIIRQLERQRNAIDRALGALREIDGTGTAPAKRRGRPPGKKFSAEARRRMSEAQRRRYAAQRAPEANAAKQPAPSAKKKRSSKRYISPEGRARIAEAARKMWAARKKAGKKAA